MALKITKTRAAKTKPAKAPKPDVAREPGRYDHVPIADLDVVLLQTKDNFRLDLEDVVFNVFESEAHRWRAGAPWLAFLRKEMPHHAGKSVWLGLSRSVPLPVLDVVQAVLRAAGMEVERDMGRALHLEMNPFARMSDDGLEILVPAALVGDPHAHRVIDRGGVKVIARGYTITPSKAGALNQLFFGSGE